MRRRDEADDLMEHCADLERRGQEAYETAQDQGFGELVQSFYDDCIVNGIGYGDVGE
jgi:hypothetical protein